MSSEIPLQYELAARAIADAQVARYATWLASSQLTEQQRHDGISEVIAHSVHEGISMGMSLLEDGPPIEDLILKSQVLGYIQAITDIDKGQGAQ